MSEDFDLEIFCRDGMYLIVARDFGVAVRNRDLQAGVQEAWTRIAEVNEWFREVGLEPRLAKPGRRSLRESGSDRPRVRSRLMEYVPPALISGAILAAFVLLASVPLFSAVAHLNATLEQFASTTSGAGIANFGRNAVDLIVRAGDTMEQVTPERKEELRLAVRKIMKGLAPIIEEVGDSIEHDTPTPPPAR